MRQKLNLCCKIDFGEESFVWHIILCFFFSPNFFLSYYVASCCLIKNHFMIIDD